MGIGYGWSPCYPWWWLKKLPLQISHCQLALGASQLSVINNKRATPSWTLGKASLLVLFHQTNKGVCISFPVFSSCKYLMIWCATFGYSQILLLDIIYAMDGSRSTRCRVNMTTDRFHGNRPCPPGSSAPPIYSKLIWSADEWWFIELPL